MRVFGLEEFRLIFPSKLPICRVGIARPIMLVVMLLEVPYVDLTIPRLSVGQKPLPIPALFPNL